MSRRTQLTTKFIFQVLAQLSENFIFIYLGLTLFVETTLEFKPLFILVTLVAICGARWLSVFPLSKAINWVIRLRARRKGLPEADELPWHYQAMLFWAGLRGAVGVALAAGLQGSNGPALRATVLVVVVLTVIIFGGTTARMLEILGIRTGVVEEIDSDDEFDIETANGGTYYKRSGTGFGHNPKPSIGLDYVDNSNVGNAHGRPNGSARRPARADRGYSSSNRHSPPIRPGSALGSAKQRTNSIRDREQGEQAGRLLGSSGTPSDEDSDDDGIDLDLPPAAPRRKSPSPMPVPSSGGDRSRSAPGPAASDVEHDNNGDMGASTAPQGAGGIGSGIRDLWRGARGAADHTAWLKQLDEDFIKPTLLLDQGQGQGRQQGDVVGGPSV